MSKKLTDKQLCEIANMPKFKKNERINTIKSMAMCGNPFNWNLRETLIEEINNVDPFILNNRG